MKRVYLDNNATTRIDDQVLAVMMPYLTEKYGNPNSLHRYGSEVHPALSAAMDQLYSRLGASDDDDIIINSGATEGNNTVFKSVLFNTIRKSEKNHIITSQTEHPSVRQTCEFLESEGVEVTYLPPNSEGITDLETLKKYIKKDRTALVSIMWANNETGLISPIKELATYCRDNGILFHTDATQAVGKIPVNLRDVEVDYLTFSAHKFHGPKGIGGLYVKSGRKILPLFHGGEQMGGRRSGTLNVPAIVGMGKALELATDNISQKIEDISKLRNRLEDAIVAMDDTLVIGKRELRTPNTILASFRGVEGESLIWDLNHHQIAASTGSACASESLQSNPTFVALKVDNELAHTGIRLSLSRFTSDEDIDYVIDILNKSVVRLRGISSSY